MRDGNPNLAHGTLLAQLMDLSASAQVAYSAVAQTEIQNIVVCNTSSAVAKFSIYHADTAGNGYSAGTALFRRVALPAGTTEIIGADEYGTGITVKDGGSLGVECDKTAVCTFSVYGSVRAAR